MNFKEKLMKYAAMQKEAIEILTKNEKESAIAKMSEAAEAFDEIVTEAPEEVTPQAPETTPAEPAKAEDEQLTGEEIKKLKKYASLYADAPDIKSLLDDMKAAQETINTLTKKVDDQAAKIETLEKTKGVSQQASDESTIHKTSNDKRPSLSI